MSDTTGSSIASSKPEIAPPSGKTSDASSTLTQQISNGPLAHLTLDKNGNPLTAFQVLGQLLNYQLGNQTLEDSAKKLQNLAENNKGLSPQQAQALNKQLQQVKATRNDEDKENIDQLSQLLTLNKEINAAVTALISSGLQSIVKQGQVFANNTLNNLSQQAGNALESLSGGQNSPGLTKIKDLVNQLTNSSANTSQDSSGITEQLQEQVTEETQEQANLDTTSEPAETTPELSTMSDSSSEYSETVASEMEPSDIDSEVSFEMNDSFDPEASFDTGDMDPAIANDMANDALSNVDSTAMEEGASAAMSAL